MEAQERGPWPCSWASGGWFYERWVLSHGGSRWRPSSQFCLLFVWCFQKEGVGCRTNAVIPSSNSLHMTRLLQQMAGWEHTSHRCVSQSPEPLHWPLCKVLPPLGLKVMSCQEHTAGSAASALLPTMRHPPAVFLEGREFVGIMNPSTHLRVPEPVCTMSDF